MVVPGRGRAHFAAAVAYLGLALWTMGPVLPRMADSYPMPADAKVGPISDSDQSHMIWVASRTARVLVTAPLAPLGLRVLPSLPESRGARPPQLRERPAGRRALCPHRRAGAGAQRRLDPHAVALGARHVCARLLLDAVGPG